MLSSLLYLSHQAVYFGTSVSWEVNRHTMRYTGPMPYGHEALFGVWLRVIESEISAVLWSKWPQKDVYLHLPLEYVEIILPRSTGQFFPFVICMLFCRLSDFLVDCAERIMVMKIVYKRLMNRYQPLCKLNCQPVCCNLLVLYEWQYTSQQLMTVDYYFVVCVNTCGYFRTCRELFVASQVRTRYLWPKVFHVHTVNIVVKIPDRDNIKQLLKCNCFQTILSFLFLLAAFWEIISGVGVALGKRRSSADALRLSVVIYPWDKRKVAVHLGEVPGGRQNNDL